jgi:hypothetical protein
VYIALRGRRICWRRRRHNYDVIAALPVERLLRLPQPLGKLPWSAMACIFYICRAPVHGAAVCVDGGRKGHRRDREGGGDP